ncbi:hypothetical protein [Parapedobacter tibetensis]|nr:hypothetical protein [Parapedobacter tibetensis]
MPNLILDYGFGLYNQSNNRKGVAAIMGGLDYYMGAVQPITGFGILNYRANYGENVCQDME